MKYSKLITVKMNIKIALKHPITVFPHGKTVIRFLFKICSANFRRPTDSVSDGFWTAVFKFELINRWASKERKKITVSDNHENWYCLNRSYHPINVINPVRERGGLETSIDWLRRKSNSPFQKKLMEYPYLLTKFPAFLMNFYWNYLKKKTFTTNT